MSTDAQNPRYSYLTFNRVINGTGSFELDITGSTIYRLDTNTSTVDIKLNNSGNSNIPLISKRRIDVGSNGFTKIIVSHTAIAAPETLTLLIGASESSNTDLGVEISDYSTSITGALTIGGTVDVDLVGQTGADPLNFNLTQIGGSTTEIPYLQNYLTQFNGMQTDRIAGWTYLVTTPASLIYTVPANFDAWITSANLSGFQLTAGDSSLFLYHGNAAGAITTVLLTFTMNQVALVGTAQDGTNTVSVSFGHLGYKIPSGDTLYCQSSTFTWGSATFQGYRTPV